MSRSCVIEVPAPEAEAAGSFSDEELVRSLCRAIAQLPHGEGSAWKEEVRSLEEGGWTVRWGLTWVAEARRDSYLERGLGKTRDEAFGELHHLTMVDAVENCP